MNILKVVLALVVLSGITSKADASSHYTRRELAKIFSLVGSSWERVYVVCSQLHGEIDGNSQRPEAPYIREIRCSRSGEWLFSANGAANHSIAMVGVFPLVDPFRLEREWHHRLGSNGQVVGTSEWRVINRYSLDRLLPRWSALIYPLPDPSAVSAREFSLALDTVRQETYRLAQQLFNVAHARVRRNYIQDRGVCRARLQRFSSMPEGRRVSVGMNVGFAIEPYIYLDNRREPVFESWGIRNNSSSGLNALDFGFSTPVSSTRTFSGARESAIRVILRSQLPSSLHLHSCLGWLGRLYNSDVMYGEFY